MRGPSRIVVLNLVIQSSFTVGYQTPLASIGLPELPGKPVAHNHRLLSMTYMGYSRVYWHFVLDHLALQVHKGKDRPRTSRARAGARKTPTTRRIIEFRVKPICRWLLPLYARRVQVQV